MCRSSEETTTCVGRVVHFVKCTPRDALATRALLALGLPTEPQRFAIVEAYTATLAQQACQGLALQTPWVLAVARALVSSGVLADRKSFLHLLRKVSDWATVLRVGKQCKVRLARRPGNSGELHRLAIPLSSKYEAWYHKDNEHANLTVTPLVRIDPRKAKVQMTPSSPGMSRAIEDVKKTLMYFVYTHSMSNSRL
jgi:hypothetical protein